MDSESGEPAVTSRPNREAVAALVKVVTSPTTTQPTWASSTTSKAAPSGWCDMAAIFTHCHGMS